MPGNRVQKLQTVGTKGLRLEVQRIRKLFAFRTVILRITQNRESHMLTMHTKLVRTAGDGGQRQFTAKCKSLQYPEMCEGRLSLRMYLPQKAG